MTAELTFEKFARQSLQGVLIEVVGMGCGEGGCKVMALEGGGGVLEAEDEEFGEEKKEEEEDWGGRRRGS